MSKKRLDWLEHPRVADSKPVDDVAVIPIVEEELQLSKREIVTGRVRIQTITDTVEEHVRQELTGQRVEVQRVPIDLMIEENAAPPQIRTEGNVTIVPVLEEVLVVQRRLVLKEELRITRHHTTEQTDVAVTLRKQRAEIERLEGET